MQITKLITLIALLLTLNFCETFAQEADTSLKIVSYNLRNFDFDVRLNTRTDTELLVNILKEKNSDIYAFQEIVNKDLFDTIMRENFAEYSFVLSRCGGFGRQSLAIVYKKSKLKLIGFKEDRSLSNSSNCNQGLRPALIAHFEIIKSGISFRLIDLHLKAGSSENSEATRKGQLNVVTQILNKFVESGEQNFIVVGDLNSTSFTHNTSGNENLLDFISRNNLVNYASQFKCTSYWRPNSNSDIFEASILDHIMISTPLTKIFHNISGESGTHCKTNSCGSTPKIDLGRTYSHVSDHCPIQLNLN